MIKPVRSPFVCILLAAISALARAACPTSTCLPDGTQSSGAKYRICIPDPACWNGNLVVYAHGYVPPTKPIAIPESQLVINGVSLPQLVNQLGYGFAVSSFRTNGLAVLEGIQDTKDLVNIFSNQVGAPGRVYVVGASEGGLVTALSLEQFPDVYRAALPACGPIGNFQRQLNYVGDFRVVFDYFFPGVIPGTAIPIPAEVMANWNTVIAPAILSAVQSHPSATSQLLKVTHAAIGTDAASVAETIVGLLWYSVFATNDAIAKLGGQPFDNSNRTYAGSLNDQQLNSQVQRFHADPAALAEVRAHYQTTGKLTRPAVTLHTTGDPIVPYWHEPLYELKTILGKSGQLHVNIPASGYGHCNFNASELLLGFGLMISKDMGQPLAVGTENLLPEEQRAQFVGLGKQLGVLAH